MFRLKAPTKKPVTTNLKNHILIRDRIAPLPNTPLTPPLMQPGIWSRLPDEILDLILLFLPFKTLMNLRSTCKRFRSLIVSPCFLSKHSLISLSSFLLLSHPQCYNCFPLYDSNLRAWRRLALPSSDPLSCAAVSAGDQKCTLLSSSDGLLCFSRPISTSSSSSLFVCNLLTRSSRSIDFPFYPFPFELLTLISTPLGYKIFTLCSSSGGGFFSPNSRRHVYVYDSVDRSWREFDGFNQTLARGFHQEGVFYKGSLYFAKTEPFLIINFDLETGKWNESAGNGTIPGIEVTFSRLVRDPEKNRLYLVGGTGSNGISRSIKLWQLGEDEIDGEQIWNEVETVPEMICRKFMSVCYHNYDHVYCFWHKGMVCVCCYNWPEILYFEVERRTWHWIPKCPNLPDKWSCGFRWFSFVPTFSASV